MTATHHSPTDVLIYTRESLDTTLDWIHTALAEAYGVDLIDGEEYLPGVLNDVMSSLYAMHWELTDECVRMGGYLRENGFLYRPRAYSHGLPVYVNTKADLHGDHMPISRLNHPSDDHSVSDHAKARHAGSIVENSGGHCA